jgi:hypothetical protein
VRVLHVDLGRELRGGQHQVLLLLKVLRKDGHMCRLLARGPLLERASALGLDASPASLMTFRRLSSEYELVHVHDAKSHTWAALASRSPFVVSRRVAFPIATSPLAKIKYRRAARFLAVSRFVAMKLREGGVPESKLDIVYDSVEAPESVPAWSADAPVIALATVDPLKGRDLIERAAEMARIPVTFSHDLLKDLSHASAFIYVSRSEGFGSAALLAMAMGVPLIASPIDGMAEVFEPGISGLAVENDPASIAAALQRLLANPALAQSLARQGRARATDLFNTGALLKGTLDSYGRALAV